MIGQSQVHRDVLPPVAKISPPPVEMRPLYNKEVERKLPHWSEIDIIFTLALSGVKDL